MANSCGERRLLFFWYHSIPNRQPLRLSSLGEETFAAAGKPFSQPIHKKKLKRLGSFPGSLSISDLLFRVWPDKHLENGGH